MDEAAQQDEVFGAQVPTRAVGDVALASFSAPTVYPTAWPPHVLAAMARRKGAPLRVYADGIFDLFHLGHARALEQAKKAFPSVHLLVGVCADALTLRHKGKVVLTEAERYESVVHCRWVDEVVPDAPWVVDDAFLAAHDIDFVCHDALPYSDTSGGAAGGDVYAHLRETGRFWATHRTEGISTTDLILRILKQYEDFVRRNMSRGISASDMHVPHTVQAKMAVSDRLTQLSQGATRAHGAFLALFEGAVGGLLGALRGKASPTGAEVGGGGGGGGESTLAGGLGGGDGGGGSAEGGGGAVATGGAAQDEDAGASGADAAPSESPARKRKR